MYAITFVRSFSHNYGENFDHPNYSDFFLCKSLLFFARLNRFLYFWVFKCQISACRFLNHQLLICGFYCITKTSSNNCFIIRCRTQDSLTLLLEIKHCSALNLQGLHYFPKLSVGSHQMRVQCKLILGTGLLLHSRKEKQQPFFCSQKDLSL